MTHESYHGTNGPYNGVVNSRIAPLLPGELRLGALRLFPNVNDKGESIVKFHVTNEVDMYVAKTRLAHIQAMMWVAITFLFLATFSGLMVYLR